MKAAVLDASAAVEIVIRTETGDDHIDSALRCRRVSVNALADRAWAWIKLGASGEVDVVGIHACPDADEVVRGATP